jgi:hypothetical protein
MTKLETTSRPLLWLGMIGVSLIVAGMMWVALLLHAIRDYPEAIKYEVRAPWTPRLMAFGGVALLVIAATGIGISRYRQRE